MSNTTATAKALNTYFKTLFKGNEDLLSDDDVSEIQDAMERISSILDNCLSAQANEDVSTALANITQVCEAYSSQACKFLQD